MLKPAVATIASFACMACPGPRRPQTPAAESSTVAIGRDGASLRGVAGDGTTTYAALGTGASSIVEARRSAQVVWSVELPGTVGAIAPGYAAVAVPGSDPTTPLRGDPAALVVAVDATGAVTWKTPFEASDWATIAELVPTAGGPIVAGAFSGSLRVGSLVVSSGGKSDGFVARLGANGTPTWLVRIGGPGADAVQGVDVRDGKLAIAGTFAAGAELGGVPLPAFDERVPYADGFVAELDERTGTRKWAASFGGEKDDAVAGVAIDASGRVAIAGTARETVHVGGVDLVAQGDADGVVAWWTRDGAASHAVLIGGPDFDGIRAITSVGDRIIVGGFFSGGMQLGDRTLTAGGGDDSFVVALDDRGTVRESWQIGGAGREEIAALAPVPGGFLAGVAYTAAADLAGAELPAPRDPMAGAALVIRGVH